MPAEGSEQGHRNHILLPRPVLIEFQTHALEKAMRSPSIVVDDADLRTAFGQRVQIVRQPNTAVHLRMRSARFNPPLTVEDASLLGRLVAQYQRRLAHRGPVIPPLKRQQH